MINKFKFCLFMFRFIYFQLYSRSIWKNLGESMACNTPVICFKNTAIAEIIDHKINGYIVEDLNPEGA